MAAALVAATSAVATPADAFCRSTTCSDGCSTDIDGCKTSGKKLWWKSQCISFSVQQDGSEHIPLGTIREITTKSFIEWSDRACPDGGVATMAFTDADDVVCHNAEYNEGDPNANAIIFQDYKWDYTSADNTLAKTTVTYDTDTGEILDADIEVNHAYNEYTTGSDNIVYDLQSVMTHEIGHFIGLDHTEDYSATMNANYEQGTAELRSLESDDIDALCAAYPPARDSKCNPTPKGGFTSECIADPNAEEGGCSIAPASSDETPSESNKSTLWLLLAGSFLFVRRRALEVSTT